MAFYRDVRLTTNSGNAGQVLTTDGAGSYTWIDTATGTDPTPLGHTHIISISASIFDAAFNDEAQVEREILDILGETVTFYERGVSGATLQDWNNTHWPALVTELGASVPNALVIMHIGGNNVTAYKDVGGYYGVTTTQRNDVKTELETLCNAITAQGWDLALCELTFRDYNLDGIDRNGWTKPKERYGSLEWNKNIWYPIIQELSHPHFKLDDGQSVAQLYWLTQNNPHLLQDGTHLTRVGHDVLRKRIYDTIIRRNFSRSAGTRLQRRLGQKTAEPGETTMRFAHGPIDATDVNYDSLKFELVNHWTAENIALPCTQWVDETGSYITANGTGFAGNNTAGITDPTHLTTNSMPFLYSQMRASTYTSSTATLTLGGLDDTKTYTLQISGSRSGSSELRETNITIGATTLSYVTTQADGSGNDGSYAEFTGVSPTSGEIVLNVAIKTGGFAYVGGINLIEE